MTETEMEVDMEVGLGPDSGDGDEYSALRPWL